MSLKILAGQASEKSQGTKDDPNIPGSTAKVSEDKLSKGLVVLGFGVVVFGSILVLLHHRSAHTTSLVLTEAADDLVTSAAEVSEKLEVASEAISCISRTKHIRRLHPGWKASAEKIASAAAAGFVLRPGETWVRDYTTGHEAA